MTSLFKWYLAGPMSGIPSFNFPLFHSAAAELRSQGLHIVSPAETDPPDVQAAAIASPDGKLSPDGKVASETWGDMLARDVKMLADELDGIVFLPNWTRSRGARLEAFVGILCNRKFATFDPDTGAVTERSLDWVKERVV